MSKLELKHLAPYLPYGLKCQWNQSRPFELKGLQNGSESVSNELWIWQDKLSGNYLTGYLYECKPILRPLSDLTKEIEHNGERFVPAFELDKLLYDGAFINKMTALRIEFNLGFLEKLDFKEYYSICEKLFEWKFDVFGLIPQGLAVNINTIEK